MKSVIRFAVVALAVMLLLELLTSWPLIVTLGIGIFIGVSVAIALISRSRGEKPQDVAEEVVAAARTAMKEPKEVLEERAVNEQLFRTNQALLLSAKAPKAVSELQGLTDELRIAVPRALEFSPGSETTFNLVKLGKEDLPELVHRFLDLDEVSRKRQEGNFISQLADLKQKVGELMELINRGQADAFDAQSSFLDIKFNA